MERLNNIHTNRRVIQSQSFQKSYSLSFGDFISEYLYAKCCHPKFFVRHFRNRRSRIKIKFTSKLIPVMTSTGSMILPRDLLIFRPCASRTIACKQTCCDFRKKYNSNFRTWHKKLLGVLKIFSLHNANISSEYSVHFGI